MIDRRKFLKASGVGLALPLLESMSPAWAKDVVAPKRVVFQAELPREPTGKLLKRVLREHYCR